MLICMGIVPYRVHANMTKLSRCRRLPTTFYENDGATLSDEWYANTQVPTNWPTPLPTTRFPTQSPTKAPTFQTLAGYWMYTTGGCIGQNDWPATTCNGGPHCKQLCDGDSTCVSFEFKKIGNTCLRSKTCLYDQTVKNPNDQFLFYVKSGGGGPAALRASGYTMYNTGGCNGQNELFKSFSPSNPKTLVECKTMCNQMSACVSFERKKSDHSGSGFCTLSSTCKHGQTVQHPTAPYYFYQKN